MGEAKKTKSTRATASGVVSAGCSYRALSFPIRKDCNIDKIGEISPKVERYLNLLLLPPDYRSIFSIFREISRNLGKFPKVSETMIKIGVERELREEKKKDIGEERSGKGETGEKRERERERSRKTGREKDWGET